MVKFLSVLDLLITSTRLTFLICAQNREAKIYCDTVDISIHIKVLQSLFKKIDAIISKFVQNLY